jgi:hypothetical protein
MTITVVGVDALLAKFAAGTVAADVAAAEGVGELGEDVLTQARSIVPVLTGTLRDSLTLESDGPLGRVYTDVVYAGQVEYGGLHNPPEPYLRPAADTANTEAAAIAAKAVIDSV